MNHVVGKSARRSSACIETRKFGGQQTRAAALAACEALESRLLFNAGGGWVGTGTAPSPGGGVVGVYYPTTLASGTSSFTRTDVRIDFTNTTYASGATSGQELPGGGLPNDPNFGAVPGTSPIPSNGFAVDWSGVLMPKYSETYTLAVYGTANDSSTLIIDGTTLASGAGNHTATYQPVVLTHRGR